MPSRMMSKRMSMNMPTTQRLKSHDRSVYVGHSPMGEYLRKFRILALLGRLEEEPELKHHFFWEMSPLPNALSPSRTGYSCSFITKMTSCVCFPVCLGNS